MFEALYQPDQSDLPSNALVPEAQRWAIICSSAQAVHQLTDALWDAAKHEKDERKLRLIEITRTKGLPMYIWADGVELVIIRVQRHEVVEQLGGSELTNAIVHSVHPDHRDELENFVRSRCGRWPNTPEVLQAREEGTPIAIPTALAQWAMSALESVTPERFDGG